MIETISYKERQDIERMIKEGHPGSMIAAFLGRSRNGINTEIRKNGGRETYNAREAQKRSDSVREIQNRAVSEKLKGRPDSFGMHSRIIALEQALISLSLEVEKLKKNRVVVEK
jgi:IS30 family transposase